MSDYSAMTKDEKRCANDPVWAAYEIERLEAALKSIAANTCCESCQEAKLVARAALKETQSE